MSMSGAPTDPVTPTRNLRGPRAIPVAVPFSEENTIPRIPVALSVERPDVPGYDILEELGRGGMGVVYKAWQRGLGRHVALKMLLSGIQADANEVARFNFEAQALARVHHPNIVEVFEAGWHRGQPFMALEYVEGGTLSRRLGGKQLPPRQAAEIVQTLGRALDVVHRQGLVHRDLKPANILMHSDGPGTPVTLKIGDFGLARPIGDKRQLTRTGFVVGTPEYMAPEQLQGQSDKIGPPSDVYALGVILYELLTGKRPFEAVLSIEVMELVRMHEAERPGRLNPKVPRDLEIICLKCLEKTPEKRYLTAGELADDLGRYLENQPIVARPVRLPERVWKWSRRRPAIASLIAALTIVFLLGFFGILWQWRLAEQRADSESIARHSADYHRNEAEKRRAEAEEAGKRERHERIRGESALYASRMVLTQRDFEAGNLVSARGNLNHYKTSPIPGLELRDWEWRYLNRLCDDQNTTAVFSGIWPWQIAFSPDGQQIALACGNYDRREKGDHGEIYFWGPGFGDKRGHLRGNLESLFYVSFSPDGKRVVASGKGEKFIVYDPSTNITRSLFRSFVDTPVFFTADSQSVIVQDKSPTPGIWCVRLDNGQRRALPGTKPVAIDRTGSLLLTREEKGGALLVETATGQIRQRLALGEGANELSPDGLFVATTTERHQVHIWNALDGKLVAEFDTTGGHMREIKFSPDSSLLAVASSDSMVRIYDIRSARLIRQYRGHTNGLRCMAFTNKGLNLATVDLKGTVKMWDVSWSQNGYWIPLKDNSGHSLTGAWISNVSFCKKSQTLIVSHANSPLLSYDSTSGQLLNNIELDKKAQEGRGISEDAFSADGLLFVAISRKDRRTVRLWDMSGLEKPQAQPRELRAFSLEQSLVIQLALSGDGRRLVTSSGMLGDRNELYVWDTQTGQRLRQLHGAAVFNLALNSDGRILAVADQMGKIELWDTDTGEAMPSPPALKKAGVFALSFSAKDSRLAYGSVRDGAVHIWDVSKREGLVEPLRGPAWLSGVHFNPQGTRLAAIGWDGIVHLWDARTGNELLTLRDNYWPRYDNYQYTARVLFSPDGTRLAALHWHGGVTLYDSRDADAEATARRQNTWYHETRRNRILHAIELNQWSGAVEATAQLLDVRPVDEPFNDFLGNLYLQRACALLMAEDEAGYRKLCDQMRARFGNQAEPEIVRWLGEIHSLGKHDKGVILARKAVDHGQDQLWTRIYLALAQYYAQDDESALATVDAIPAREPGKDHARRLGRLVRAMVLQRQGKTEEARREIEAFSLWNSQLLEAARLEHWALHERMEVLVLMRGAIGGR